MWQNGSLGGIDFLSRIMSCLDTKFAHKHAEKHAAPNTNYAE
jgi:hypothetical protein